MTMSQATYQAADSPRGLCQPKQNKTPAEREEDFKRACKEAQAAAEAAALELDRNNPAKSGK